MAISGLASERRPVSRGRKSKGERYSAAGRTLFSSPGSFAA